MLHLGLVLTGLSSLFYAIAFLEGCSFFSWFKQNRRGALPTQGNVEEPGLLLFFGFLLSIGAIPVIGFTWPIISRRFYIGVLYNTLLISLLVAVPFRSYQVFGKIKLGILVAAIKATTLGAFVLLSVKYFDFILGPNDMFR